LAQIAAEDMEEEGLFKHCGAGGLRLAPRKSKRAAAWGRTLPREDWLDKTGRCEQALYHKYTTRCGDSGEVPAVCSSSAVPLRHDKQFISVPCDCEACLGLCPMAWHSEDRPEETACAKRRLDRTEQMMVYMLFRCMNEAREEKVARIERWQERASIQ
jgi:hypothetical protein